MPHISTAVKNSQQASSRAPQTNTSPSTTTTAQVTTTSGRRYSATHAGAGSDPALLANMFDEVTRSTKQNGAKPTTPSAPKKDGMNARTRRFKRRHPHTTGAIPKQTKGKDYDDSYDGSDIESDDETTTTQGSLSTSFVVTRMVTHATTLLARGLEGLQTEGAAPFNNPPPSSTPAETQAAYERILALAEQTPANTQTIEDKVMGEAWLKESQQPRRVRKKRDLSRQKPKPSTSRSTTRSATTTEAKRAEELSQKVDEFIARHATSSENPTATPTTDKAETSEITTTPASTASATTAEAEPADSFFNGLYDSLAYYLGWTDPTKSTLVDTPIDTTTPATAPTATVVPEAETTSVTTTALIPTSSTEFTTTEEAEHAQTLFQYMYELLDYYFGWNTQTTVTETSINRLSTTTHPSPSVTPPTSTTTTSLPSTTNAPTFTSHIASTQTTENEESTTTLATTTQSITTTTAQPSTSKTATTTEDNSTISTTVSSTTTQEAATTPPAVATESTSPFSTTTPAAPTAVSQQSTAKPATSTGSQTTPTSAQPTATSREAPTPPLAPTPTTATTTQSSAPDENNPPPIPFVIPGIIVENGSPPGSGSDQSDKSDKSKTKSSTPKPSTPKSTTAQSTTTTTETTTTEENVEPFYDSDLFVRFNSKEKDIFSTSRGVISFAKKHGRYTPCDIDGHAVDEVQYRYSRLSHTLTLDEASLPCGSRGDTCSEPTMADLMALLKSRFLEKKAIDPVDLLALSRLMERLSKTFWKSQAVEMLQLAYAELRPQLPTQAAVEIQELIKAWKLDISDTDKVLEHQLPEVQYLINSLLKGKKVARVRGAFFLDGARKFFRLPHDQRVRALGEINNLLEKAIREGSSTQNQETQLRVEQIRHFLGSYIPQFNLEGHTQSVGGYEMTLRHVHPVSTEVIPLRPRRLPPREYTADSNTPSTSDSSGRTEFQLPDFSVGGWSWEGWKNWGQRNLRSWGWGNQADIQSLTSDALSSISQEHSSGRSRRSLDDGWTTVGVINYGQHDTTLWIVYPSKGRNKKIQEIKRPLPKREIAEVDLNLGTNSQVLVAVLINNKVHQLATLTAENLAKNERYHCYIASIVGNQLTSLEDNMLCELMSKQTPKKPTKTTTRSSTTKATTTSTTNKTKNALNLTIGVRNHKDKESSLKVFYYAGGKAKNIIKIIPPKGLQEVKLAGNASGGVFVEEKIGDVTYLSHRFIIEGMPNQTDYICLGDMAHGSSKSYGISGKQDCDSSLPTTTSSTSTTTEESIKTLDLTVAVINYEGPDSPAILKVTYFIEGDKSTVLTLIPSKAVREVTLDERATGIVNVEQIIHGQIHQSASFTIESLPKDTHYLCYAAWTDDKGKGHLDKNDSQICRPSPPTEAPAEPTIAITTTSTEPTTAASTTTTLPTTSNAPETTAATTTTKPTTAAPTTTDTPTTTVLPTTTSITSAAPTTTTVPTTTTAATTSAKSATTIPTSTASPITSASSTSAATTLSAQSSTTPASSATTPATTSSETSTATYKTTTADTTTASPTTNDHTTSATSTTSTTAPTTAPEQTTTVAQSTTATSTTTSTTITTDPTTIASSATSPMTIVRPSPTPILSTTDESTATTSPSALPSPTEATTTPAQSTTNVASPTTTESTSTPQPTTAAPTTTTMDTTTAVETSVTLTTASTSTKPVTTTPIPTMANIVPVYDPDMDVLFHSKNMVSFATERGVMSFIVKDGFYFPCDQDGEPVDDNIKYQYDKSAKTLTLKEAPTRHKRGLGGLPIFPINDITTLIATRFTGKKTVTSADLLALSRAMDEVTTSSGKQEAIRQLQSAVKDLEVGLLHQVRAELQDLERVWELEVPAGARILDSQLPEMQTLINSLLRAPMVGRVWGPFFYNTVHGFYRLPEQQRTRAIGEIRNKLRREISNTIYNKPEVELRVKQIEDLLCDYIPHLRLEGQSVTHVLAREEYIKILKNVQEKSDVVIQLRQKYGQDHQPIDPTLVTRIETQFNLNLVGIPRTHALKMQEVATDMQTVFGIRPVDSGVRKLIEENYPTKNILVKGKSSNWGLQNGFICVDQRLSKKEGHSEIIEKQNKAIQAGLDQGHFTKTQLTISDARIKELEELGTIRVIAKDEMTGRQTIEAKAYRQGQSGQVYTFIAKPKSEDAGKNLIFQQHTVGQVITEQPVEVVADKHLHEPLTADYDLFFVAGKVEGFGAHDQRHHIRVEIPQVRRGSFDLLEENRPGSRRGSSNQLDIPRLFESAQEKPLGAISERTKELMKKINEKLNRGQYREMVHHGEDAGNPESDMNDNFPATFYLPEQLKGNYLGLPITLEKVTVLKDLRDYHVLVTLLKDNGYHFTENPKWPQVRRPSYEYALNRFKAEAQQSQSKS